MKTAKELYTTSAENETQALIKVTVAIQDKLILAAKQGLFEYEVLLYQHPILQIEKNSSQYIHQLKELGFTVVANISPQYQSLSTITIKWGDL